MSDYNGNNRFGKRYGSGGGNFGGDRATGDRPSYGGGNNGNGYYGNNNRGNYGGGGNNGGGGWKGGGGNNNWKSRNEQPIDPDPYVPVVLFSNNEPPLDIINKFKTITEKLKDLKFTVRIAGGNTEAEDAIKNVAGDKLEVYLPWKMFKDMESQFQFSDESSIEQACKFHPAADKIKDSAKKFLSRNLRMGQGQKLKSPAKFMVIWTEDGASKLSDKTFKTGPSGHMLSIAAGTKTPVFNLGKDGTFEKLIEFLTPEKEPEYKRDNNNGGNNYQGNNYQGKNEQRQYREPQRDNYQQERSEPSPQAEDGFDDFDDY